VTTSSLRRSAHHRWTPAPWRRRSSRRSRSSRTEPPSGIPGPPWRPVSGSGERRRPSTGSRSTFVTVPSRSRSAPRPVSSPRSGVWTPRASRAPGCLWSCRPSCSGVRVGRASSSDRSLAIAQRSTASRRIPACRRCSAPSGFRTCAGSGPAWIAACRWLVSRIR
jgi:hypothetical protein